MWVLHLVTAAEEVPAAPPAIPFETAGIVLVALVTGITAIIVALIQRGKKDTRSAPAASGTPAVPVFVISKEDWTEVRDAVVKLVAAFEGHKRDYDLHERWTTGEVRELDNELSRIKGHLGIQ